MRNAHALAVPGSFALIVTAYYLYRRRARRAPPRGRAAARAHRLRPRSRASTSRRRRSPPAARRCSCASRGRSRRGTSRARSARRSCACRCCSPAAFARVARGRRDRRPGGDVRGGGRARDGRPAPLAAGPVRLPRRARANGARGRADLGPGGADAPPGSSSARSRRRGTCPIPSSAARRRASSREHGTDTLSFFKLRGDKHYLFNADADRVPRLPGRERRADDLRRPGRRAGRVAELVRPTCVSPRSGRCGSPRSASARRAGRSSSRPACARSTSATRRSSTRPSSRSRGARIRKVRQSVTRLEKAGLPGRLAELGSLDAGRARGSSSRSRATGSTARRSGGSAWPWTRFATRTARKTLVALRARRGRDGRRVPPVRARRTAATRRRSR